MWKKPFKKKKKTQIHIEYKASGPNHSRDLGENVFTQTENHILSKGFNKHLHLGILFSKDILAFVLAI